MYTTAKVFLDKQKLMLMKMGFQNSFKNTWFKKYGSDDTVITEDDGFYLTLNPIDDDGRIKINYTVDLENADVEDEIIDDTLDVTEIFKDIKKLKKAKIIFK